MQKLEYHISFNTPAFLGNAEQQAQWRTPPFKALLRQWWRVVRAKDVAYHPAELLREENRLFGTAADDDGGKSHRSEVRLRLSAWDQGQLRQWDAKEPKTDHPEVKFPVGTDLYLGFGPLTNDKTSKTTQLSEIRGSRSKRTAIADKTSLTLRMMFPDNYTDELQKAMQLAAWFGTLGSRSRNGWGSLHIEGEGIASLERAKLAAYLRPLQECLTLDWPHAIGSVAGKPTVWQTQVEGSWREVMRELAVIKIAFRTQFKFAGGGPHRDFQKRQLLAYPITRHNHEKLGGDTRLANQIRFKVIKQPNGKLTGLISHFPCTLPDTLLQKLGTQDQRFVRDHELAIWQAVHAQLNQRCTPL